MFGLGVFVEGGLQVLMLECKIFEILVWVMFLKNLFNLKKVISISFPTKKNSYPEKKKNWQ